MESLLTLKEKYSISVDFLFSWRQLLLLMLQSSLVLATLFAWCSLPTDLLRNLLLMPTPVQDVMLLSQKVEKGHVVFFKDFQFLGEHFKSLG